MAASENLSGIAILIFRRYFGSSSLLAFYKIGVLKIFAKFLGYARICHICQNLFLIKLLTFSLKFYWISVKLDIQTFNSKQLFFTQSILLAHYIFNPIFISGSRFFRAQVDSVYVQVLEVALKLIVALNLLLLHHIYVYNFSSINVRKYMHQTWLSLFILSINSLTLSGLPLTSFHLAEASLSAFWWLYTIVYVVIRKFIKMSSIPLILQSTCSICTTWILKLWNNNHTMHVNE